MSSKALDILTAVETLINTEKSVINTVQNEYKPLNELIQEANDAPGNFPKLILFFGESEIPVENPRQTIGTRVSYLVPIIGDLYIVKTTDLTVEVDAALKEFRDLIDNPANSKWTANNFPTQYPIGPIERATVFDTSSQSPSIVFGIASISFNVLYYFDRGNS